MKRNEIARYERKAGNEDARSEVVITSLFLFEMTSSLAKFDVLTESSKSTFIAEDVSLFTANTFRAFSDHLGPVSPFQLGRNNCAYFALIVRSVALLIM